MADGYVDKILSNPLSGKMLKVTMGQVSYCNLFKIMGYLFVHDIPCYVITFISHSTAYQMK